MIHGYDNSDISTVCYKKKNIQYANMFQKQHSQGKKRILEGFIQIMYVSSFHINVHIYRQLNWYFAGNTLQLALWTCQTRIITDASDQAFLGFLFGAHL